MICCMGTSFSTRCTPPDEPFVLWAGVWAEARYEWGSRPLDGEDEDGAEFSDYLNDAGCRRPASAKMFLAVIEESDHEWRQAGLDVDALRVNVEQEVWPRELEEVWSAIRRLAAALLAGKVLDRERSVWEVRGE